MKFFSRIGLCLSLAGQLLRVFLQLIYGAWRVSRLPKPIVSVFGGARIKKTDRYFYQAHELAQRLAQSNISVLTGGGPGIMEAASCGVIASKGPAITMGISVTDLGEGKNPCVQEYFELDHFFARKWLLTHYSKAFVVFPGGFGTLDELAEILTLIQTKRIASSPIVLVGTEYWQGFMSWISSEGLEHGSIDKNDLLLFTITDDLERVFCLVRDECAITPGDKV